MIREKLTGVGVAMITPFTSDGRVDYQALARMIDCNRGRRGLLVALGTTAETPTLYMRTRGDRHVHHQPYRRPRAAGDGLRRKLDVGGAGPAPQIDLRGADAILSVTPYYNKPSQEDFTSISAPYRSIRPCP
ncbi:MAG: dihydrodipicolinate synthase family protein [Alistipes finegoldii]